MKRNTSTKWRFFLVFCFHHLIQFFNLYFNKTYQTFHTILVFIIMQRYCCIVWKFRERKSKNFPFHSQWLFCSCRVSARRDVYCYLFIKMDIWALTVTKFYQIIGLSAKLLLAATWCLKHCPNNNSAALPLTRTNESMLHN